jgi:hypothetical protein
MFAGGAGVGVLVAVLVAVGVLVAVRGVGRVMSAFACWWGSRYPSASRYS